MQDIIYADNAATTKVDDRVLNFMLPYFSDKYGNASSVHNLGLISHDAVYYTQSKVAGFLDCDTTEVYFTSGATESNNMAILGFVEGLLQGGMSIDDMHLITSELEHDSVLESFKILEKRGVSITYVKPNNKGLISVSDIESAITDNTVLVSIMYANNEIGTIMPISEIGQLIYELNKKREHKIYFHTDATQCLGVLNCQVSYLGVDMLSFSAHKIYGPKGIGVLYMKNETPFSPLIVGGHQQRDIRSGTYNVPAIAGLGCAVDIISSLDTQKENNRLEKMRNELVDYVTSNIERASLTGDDHYRLPGNASFVFEGVSGDDLVLMLSQSGIEVSTGSACSSGSIDPSHVLQSIGIEDDLIFNSLRFSFGRFNNIDDIKKITTTLNEIVIKLRR